MKINEFLEVPFVSLEFAIASVVPPPRARACACCRTWMRFVDVGAFLFCRVCTFVCMHVRVCVSGGGVVWCARVRVCARMCVCAYVRCVP
jgi:hypothetical protein